MVPGIVVIAIMPSLAIAGFLLASGAGVMLALLAYSLSGIACILLIAGGRAVILPSCSAAQGEARNRRTPKAMEPD